MRRIPHISGPATLNLLASDSIALPRVSPLGPSPSYRVNCVVSYQRLRSHQVCDPEATAIGTSLSQDAKQKRLRSNGSTSSTHQRRCDISRSTRNSFPYQQTSYCTCSDSAIHHTKHRSVHRTGPRTSIHDMKLWSHLGRRRRGRRSIL